ncbi:hypothetical protein [Nostoc sp.]|uniref:hypothetical protein n=1 Tax=Nostoc sp. TaxID=1180 RepID=UPI002FFBC54F
MIKSFKKAIAVDSSTKLCNIILIAQKALVNFREQLKQGAIQQAERDLGLVEECFDLEE